MLCCYWARRSGQRSGAVGTISAATHRRRVAQLITNHHPCSPSSSRAVIPQPMTGAVSARGCGLGRWTGLCLGPKYSLVEQSNRAFEDAEERLDASLFDDPNAGLSLTEATEMPERDVLKELTVSSQTFDFPMYLVAFTPLVDLVHILSENQLLPPTKAPEVTLSQWLSDPRAILNPLGREALRQQFGEEAFARFTDAVVSWHMDVELLMPLQRVASRYGVASTSPLIPLLRLIGTQLWSRSWEVKHQCLQQLPNLVLGLAAGKAESVVPVAPLTIEGGLRRTQFIGEMLVALGQEVGHASPAFLGIQLLRANHIKVPYRTQKSLTNVFSAVQRVKTDWDLRYSGASRQAIPRWLKGYLKQAERDASAAKKESFLSQVASSVISPSNVVVAVRDDDGGSQRTTTTADAVKVDSDVSSYFQRRINDDVVQMRRNIAKKLEVQQERLRRQEMEADEQRKQKDMQRAADNSDGKPRRRGRVGR